MWEILEKITLVLGIPSSLGIFILVWNNIRHKLLSATLDGKKISVPCDDVKESFRRSALAEISRLNGGKRVDVDLDWKKNKLIITTRKRAD